jgi:hypothetical protein
VHHWEARHRVLFVKLHNRRAIVHAHSTHSTVCVHHVTGRATHASQQQQTARNAIPGGALSEHRQSARVLKAMYRLEANVFVSFKISDCRCRMQLKLRDLQRRDEPQLPRLWDWLLYVRQRPLPKCLSLWLPSRYHLPSVSLRRNDSHTTLTTNFLPESKLLFE